MIIKVTYCLYHSRVTGIRVIFTPDKVTVCLDTTIRQLTIFSSKSHLVSELSDVRLVCLGKLTSLNLRRLAPFFSLVLLSIFSTASTISSLPKELPFSYCWITLKADVNRLFAPFTTSLFNILCTSLT